jgi:transcriptional regulator with XRE-family HTH domain
MDDPEDQVASLLGAAFARRLRLRHGLERAAELAGLSEKTLQRYEKGEAVPPPKTLALLARAAGFSSSLLEHIRRPLEAHELARAGGLAGEPASPRGPLPALPALPAEIAAEILAAVEEAAGILVIEPAPASWEETGKPRPEDRERADELWRRFLSQDRDERYGLVRESSAFRLWSFAERLARESDAAAAESPAEALKMARLSLEIARAVRGTPSWRARVESCALSSLGKALRACNEPDRARAAFAQARALQAAFSPSDPPLLDESVSLAE